VKGQRAMLADTSTGALVSRVCWLAVAAIALVFSSCRTSAKPPADRSLLLFTPQEAQQLRLSTGEWPYAPRARSLSIGPQIVVRRPQVVPGEIPTIEAESPTDLDVIFEPRGAPVRMDSLSVAARKGFFSKSLTEMLRPYIRGNSLELSKVEIPTGRFMLNISIADTNGNTTNATYRLEVGRK
jgi:hypothetical protein